MAALLLLAGCAQELGPAALPNAALTVAPTSPPVASAVAPDARERVVIDEPVPYSVAITGGARAAAAGGRATTVSLAGTTRSVAPPASAASAASREVPFDVVTVLWGTDRKVELKRPEPPTTREADQPVTTSALPLPSPLPQPVPTAERADRLTTGAAVVTIPRKARAAGTITRPRQYTLLNMRYYSEAESPERHFTIASLRVLERGELALRADTLLERSRRFKNQVVVFVHGYNTQFDEALYRTAQIAHDLELDGLAAMYSWPSRGRLVDYSYDLNSAARAETYLIEFLTLIAARTRAERIHIIAHSMGNRTVIEALRSLQQTASRGVRQKIGQVILAAPDVDRDLFAEITARLEIGSGRTLYASNEDKALRLSRQADGVPRAGDVPRDGPIVIAGVDTIDISAASTRALLSSNHSDYAERSHILKDMQLLIETGTRPPDARFPLYKVAEARGGRYWRYVPNR